MQKKSKILILILPVFFNNTIFGMKSSPYVLTFFLKAQSPSIAKQTSSEDLQNLKNPTGKAIKSIVNSLYGSYPVSGVYAVYNGNATISDANGQITFLRKVVEPKLHVLITEEIEPLLINPLQKNLIEGFVIEPHISHKYYLLELIENKATKNYEWKAQEEIISKRKKIPYNTIILFANPKSASISTENRTFKMDGNLLLPDIYIKTNPELQLTALSFLKIRQYFSRVKKKYEFKPGLYQERIA